MAPEFIAMAIASFLFNRLSRRTGTPLLMITSYVFIGLALLLLAQSDNKVNYLIMSCWLILLGTGTGVAVPATSLLIMCSVVPQRSGIASSVMNAFRQTGMTLGVALLGSLMNMKALDSLTASLQQQGIASAKAIAHAIIFERNPIMLSGENAEMWQYFIHSALTTGFNIAMLVAAWLSLILSGWLALFFRSRHWQKNNI